MARSDIERGFIALTPDIKKAHDFKDGDSAKAWMIGKSLSGSILEVKDDDSESEEA